MKSLHATEEQEHIAFIQWAQTQKSCKDYLIHIPNGEKRDIKTATKLKRMGVRPGVSDFFLAKPYGSYAGLWMELKRIGGKLTDAQRRWLENMEDLGYMACICFGSLGAIDCVQYYLGYGSSMGFKTFSTIEYFGMKQFKERNNNEKLLNLRGLRKTN